MKKMNRPKKATAADRIMPRTTTPTEAVNDAVIALAGLSMNENLPKEIRAKCESIARRLAKESTHAH